MGGWVVVVMCVYVYVCGDVCVVMCAPAKSVPGFCAAVAKVEWGRELKGVTKAPGLTTTPLCVCVCVCVCVCEFLCK